MQGKNAKTRDGRKKASVASGKTKSFVKNKYFVEKCKGAISRLLILL